MPNSVNQRLAVSLAAMCLAALVCAGCAEDAQESAAPGTGEESAPGAADGGASGLSEVAPMPSSDKAALLPAGFPTEIPVLDATVVNATEEMVEGREVWRYQLSSDADPEAVADWYRTAYSGANWQLLQDTTGEDGTVLVFGKGDGVETLLSVGAEGDGTSVRASIGFGVSLSGSA
jgi:hypothetical protein